MHMSDALLSPIVSGVMTAASVGAVAYTIAKIKKDDLDEKKIPMMGVMGAFVFAAQMINFTIPVTGSSGHIGGGILLVAMLGPYPAFLTISAVLLIQALFFADGGLLALGANIFNMGFAACFIAYPLIFRPIVKRGITVKSLTLASILSIVVGLQIGAFGVVLETLASGITELPFGAFVALMQPIHLAIGLVEGIVTAAVLCFVYKVRPEILESVSVGAKIGNVSLKKILVILIAATLVVGGGLSLFASSNPDGLEWAIKGVTGSAELESSGSIYDTATDIQKSTAFMPDYSFNTTDGEGSAVGTSSAGIIGGAITLVLAAATGFVISLVKKKAKTRV